MTGGLIVNSAVVSIAGGALSLDRTAAFQTMASRPLVAAPVIGYILGNAPAGLAVGVLLELLFIGDLPVGRYMPVHETGLAVIATALTVVGLDAIGGRDAPPWDMRVLSMAPMALVVALPVCRVHQKADEAARRLNAGIFSRAEARLDAGVQTSLAAENLKGVALFFIAGTLSTFFTLTPLIYAERLALERAPAASLINPAFAACAIIGVAAAYKAVETHRGLMIFSLAGLLAAALLAFIV